MVPTVSIARIWRQMWAICFLIGCTSIPESHDLREFQFEQPAMGTQFRIVLFAQDINAAKRGAAAAFSRVAGLDRMMTDYDPQSELLQLSRATIGQPVPLSRDLFTALHRAHELAQFCNGAIDPTVGPYVQIWRRARRQRELPAPEKIIEVAPAVGWTKLILNTEKQTATLHVQNMRLDLGGIAKGYAADAALRVLREHGIGRALVAASGDLAIGDPPPGKPGWSIGMMSFASDKPDRTAVLRNCGVSTSGDTQQFLELNGVRYSHIVDPRTGQALTNRISVSIIAPDATTSDVLATAVCVLGAEKGLLAVRNLSGVQVRAVSLRDGKPVETTSEGFPKNQK